MLTEEKIQKLLDDLRFGAYDTCDYTVSCSIAHNCGLLTLKDLKKKVCLHIRFYGPDKFIFVTKTIFGIPFTVKKNKPQKATAQWVGDNSWNSTEEIEISNDLYDSLYKFAAEQTEKSKLLDITNIETAFDLK